MNTILISKYLQFLRKSHHYTQENLAEYCGVSRQAVSKWETGTTIPDLDILLKISKLYKITINEILEPKLIPEYVSEFEQIRTVPGEEIREALKEFDMDSLAIALLGASPETNHFIKQIFPENDLVQLEKQLGRVQVDVVEEMQSQVVAMINLHSQNRELP